MTPTQGEHAQTEAMYAAAMEFAAEKASISYVQRKCRCSYNDAERMLERMVSEGIIETYGGRKTVATTPAQPAPQGVAYAELPDMAHCDMQYAVDVLDAIANRQRIGDGVIEPVSDIRQASKLAKEGARRLHRAINAFDTRASHGQASASRITVEQVEDAVGLQSTAWDTIGAEKIVEAVLRLANGQAPAGAADARSDALCDSSYVAGAKAGFNLGVEHDYDALSRLVEGRHGYLQVLAATRPLPAPTAQAAPAADYDHGPQSLTVAEAARHVGKWLNERPNRPLDLRDVAMLVAHAQAPAAGAVAVPRETLVAWRQWCAQSMSHAIEHEISDWLAAAHTPAAQADRVTAPTYSIDADLQGIRARVAEAITGAQAFGAQGANPPPAGHWLEPFWESARWEAIRAKPVHPNADTLYLLRRLLANQHTLTGSEFRAELGKIVEDAHAITPPAHAADSVLEDAAREAIEKVLALFPFNVPIQKFTINNGPCLTADNDDEFYSVKRVLAFLTEIKTTLAAARKQGGA